jgi:hypothetical protein
MSDRLRFRARCVATLALWLATAIALPAATNQANLVRTLSRADFLRPPTPDAAAAAAVTPPTVDVWVFADLPAQARGTLWSSWGDGRLASNGRYYTSIGNHLELAAGRGESRVYEYDPASKSVRQIVNIRDIVADPNIAAGKIHARIEETADGRLWFATYWGKGPKEADWQAGFAGSGLFGHDPRDGRTEYLGVPVPGQGLPTSILDPKRNRLYFLAAYSNDFIAYDLDTREIKYRGNGDIQEGTRNIMLDARGQAWFSVTDGFLARYNPDDNQVTVSKAQLPGGDSPGRRGGRSLRASTAPARDGVIYGITRAGHMFRFDPAAQTVTSLGLNHGNGEYTAVMVLSPDDKYVYYAPGAHGSGARIGSPVVQYDVAANRHKVLAWLNPVLRAALNYNVGGTYNMQISPEADRLFITFNGASLDDSARRVSAFGRPCIVVVHIPKEERP